MLGCGWAPRVLRRLSHSARPTLCFRHPTWQRSHLLVLGPALHFLNTLVVLSRIWLAVCRQWPAQDLVR